MTTSEYDELFTLGVLRKVVGMIPGTELVELPTAGPAHRDLARMQRHRRGISRLSCAQPDLHIALSGIKFQDSQRLAVGLEEFDPIAIRIFNHTNRDSRAYLAPWPYHAMTGGFDRA